MNTIYTNSANKKKIYYILYPHILLLNFTDKTDLRKKANILLYHGSYSLSDIQDYFEYILKHHGEKIANLSIKIYSNKIENRITSKIKTGYYLEL